MVSAIDAALSGLNAASTRLSVSANNIANQDSTESLINGQLVNQPYIPQQVDQISLSTGGVLAQVGNVNPATITAPNTGNPANGLTVQLPNVDQADQLIQQNLAAYDFQANLKTIQTQDNMDKSLLDIIA